MTFKLRMVWLFGMRHSFVLLEEKQVLLLSTWNWTLLSAFQDRRKHAGSPTLGGHMPTQVSSMLGSILRLQNAKTLPCGVYGSFGWSGEAVDILQDRLTNAGFQAAFKPIRVQFRPDAKALQICEESGTDLAQLILKTKRKSQKSKEQRSSSITSSQVPGVVQLCFTPYCG
jgi:hypothetical protein